MQNPEPLHHDSGHQPSDQQPPTSHHSVPETTKRGGDGGTAKRVAAILFVVLVIVAGYAALLNYFQNEADSRSTAVEVGKVEGEHGLEVSAWLVSADQQQEQAVIRVNFEPKGDIANEDGTLKETLRLYVNSANAAQDRTFDRGKLMNPSDVTVDLYDSSITKYPFDRFKASFVVSATAEMPVATAEGENGGDKESPTTATSKETVDIPVAVSFYGGLHGLKVEANNSSSKDGVTEVNFQVSRSRTTLAIAWFVMILLLAIASAVLTVTLMVVLWGRKLELPIVGLLGALMFGFLAFRNTLPGAPPIGSMSDYIAFFWAEGILAMCVFTLVATYFIRLARPAPTS